MTNSQALSVEQLNGYLVKKFESDSFLKGIYVKGEISNFVNHYKSGHFYFTLKDKAASIKAVMFRSNAGKLPFTPENGMMVVLCGDVGVYGRDGVYQIYVESMEPDGVGSLHVAFEQLKEKLSAEGLFDPQYKKPLPRYPEIIGVITSETGAALQDILNILTRRYPVAKVVLLPVLVQGESAARSMVEAVKRLDKQARCDVIIIGRGGGSIEDLWAFNNEELARAIFECKIPVVSAVGHEIDYTISDFVADLRAATPSAAAELVSPNINDVRYYISQLEGRMVTTIEKKLERCVSRLDVIKSQNCMRNPYFVLEKNKQKLDYLSEKIEENACRRWEISYAKIEQSRLIIDSLSPLKVLKRGYSIALKENKAINSVKLLKKGDTITTRLQDGIVVSKITQLNQT